MSAGPLHGTALDTARIDLRNCACGSGLRHLRCCGLVPAGLPTQEAAQAVAPLLQRWQEQPDGLAPGRDESPLLLALELAPHHRDALHLLYARRATLGPAVAADALLHRFVFHHPNDVWGRCELALRLLGRADTQGAEHQARSAVRLAPMSAQAQEIAGTVLLEQNRGHAAEYHLRRALDLGAARHAGLLAKLGTSLRQQSRLAESRGFYREAAERAPGSWDILFGWALTEEAAQDLARAMELLNEAGMAAPANAAIQLRKAELLARLHRQEEALAVVDAIKDPGCEALMVKGRILDRLHRPGDAFAAWQHGKARYVSQGGHSYPEAEIGAILGRLRDFYTAQRISHFPRATVAAGEPQPIFIVGFPRSGTTLIEQMLCAHEQIAGGDELPMIHALTRTTPQLLGSPLGYPEALAELWMGDGQEGLDILRDQYLRGARHLRASDPGRAWFTDKMPLNETHLGLISLLFPASPIIQLVRHPLDVVLSVFSNLLTHGYDCASTLGSAALHFARIADLVAHYRSEMAMRHLLVRYEDLVVDPEAGLRRILGFIGVPFDARCLNFTDNQRYARTASHAQVTEPLYLRSRYRWRAYRDHLQPVIPILRPAIERLGYTVD